MKSLLSLIVSIVALALLTVAAPAQAALINGSFETGQATSSFNTYYAGSTSIAGWTLTQGSIDHIGPYWQAADGNRSLDLNGTSAGGIAQAFATTPGQSYTVTFDMAANPVGGPALRTMRVLAAGQSADFVFDATGHTTTNMGWTQMTWQFVADDNLTTLEFRSMLSGAYGPALDNVVVVPEPATMALLAFGGLLAIRRKRA